MEPCRTAARSTAVAKTRNSDDDSDSRRHDTSCEGAIIRCNFDPAFFLLAESDLLIYDSD